MGKSKASKRNNTGGGESKSSDSWIARCARERSSNLSKFHEACLKLVDTHGGCTYP